LQVRVVAKNLKNIEYASLELLQH